MREYAAFAHETIPSLCPVRQNLDFTPESHPSLCAVRNNLELTQSASLLGLVRYNMEFTHEVTPFKIGVSCEGIQAASRNDP